MARGRDVGGRLLDELKERLGGRVDSRLVARLVREDRVRR